jgi:two-component system phosphate regulon sensor histidine kinase PhoR
MAKKVFTYIFPSTLIVILLAIGVVSWLFSAFFRDYYLKMTQERLKSNALAMRYAVTPMLSKDNMQALDKLVCKISEDTDTRVTVIDIKGKVLADSNENPIDMENHATANRREILDAMKGTVGQSIRFSSTLNKDTMYVAVPIIQNGKVVAVLRTSFFLNAIQRFLNRTYFHIIEWALVVAAVAICISYLLSRQISKPLEQLKEAAANFAKGDFRIKTPVSGIAEIRNLSESMNRMSESLQANINKITQQKNELKLILSSMFEGVIAIDLDDKIITMNSAAKKILNTNIPISSGTAGNKVENATLNYPQVQNDEKYTSRKFRETIRNIEIHHLVDEILENGHTINRQINLKGLRSKTLNLHGAVLRDYSGSMVGVLLVVSDITKISQLENMRRNFAANVSHELKTPLTAIKGAVETLIDGAILNKNDADKFLRIIYKHSERLNALISDIMSLSKIEQDSIELTPCSLSQILNTSLEICGEKAEQNKVSLSLECDEKLTVPGNEQMLEQVFVNLIDNAIKFSPENESVLISASRTVDVVSVSVTDHGCGIPEEHIPRLFERFYRVDKGRSRREGGTGLGLAIVKHIVNSHNGAVDVLSVPGEYTVFTVKLPFQVYEV